MPGNPHTSVQSRQVAAERRALREQAGRDRYARAQRRATRGDADVSGGAHPLEFDDRGFPVPQGQPAQGARSGQCAAGSGQPPGRAQRAGAAV